MLVSDTPLPDAAPADDASTTSAPTPTAGATDWTNSPEVEARVEELLAQMSLDEKAHFVTGDWNFNFGFFSSGLERLGIPNFQMADGPAGVRINNVGVHDGRATALPAPIALAATWDPELAHDYGTVIGVECRATDHNVSLGPAVDIARVPIAGRTFESYGEDPLLTSQIGVGVVKGIQEQGVQACAKHYAINNQEHERSSASSDIDERTMMELYLRPFEALVEEGGVASMMASFNRVNGTFACENPELLLDILRDRFDFRGWIMSDYGANHSTADAANAGLDNEQPGEGFWGGKLADAVRNGEVAEGALDGKIRNMLRPLIGLGQIENPVGITEFDEDGHHATAQRIAENGMVLLRNDGVLPLSGVAKLALIGPDVDAATATGGGSSTVRPTRTVTPLDGLVRALGDGVEVEIAYGTDPVTPGALLKGADPIPSGFFRTPEGETGLHAEYWTNKDLEGDPFHVRTDPQIDLNLGFFNFPGFNACSARYTPLPGELNGQMSARWTGTLIPPVSGRYTFSLSALGDVAFSLNGITVIDSTTDVAGSDASSASVESLATPVESDDPKPVLPTSGYGYGYGHQIDNGAPGVAADYERTLTLVGGRSYTFDLEYRANHPSQGFLTGANLRLGWTTPAGVVAPSVVEAAALAARSDAAVVIVRTYESEADDRPHLHLPNGQDALIREVIKANPRTVVVLMAGAPVAVNAWDGEPAALLQAWYPGQTQGDALARVLTGSAEPAGRLPLTLPADLSQTPVADPAQYPGIDGRVAYSDGVFVGYRSFDAAGEDPAYPFGHGLSYTSFDYSDLDVAQGDGDGVAQVSCTVRNTGGRAGSEVVQLYVGTLPTEVATAPKQLAAFRKVQLEPGASERVTLTVPVRAVSFYDADAHDWSTPAGEVDVYVAASSRDVRLTGTIAVS
jgi:beta-glucosidase